MTVQNPFPPALFRRGVTLSRKLILSYAAIGIFMLASVLISVYGLITLNTIVTEVAKKDVASLTDADRLRELLVSQERLAGKYLILKDPEYTQLYRKAEQRFLTLVPPATEEKADALAKVSGKYGAFRREVDRQFNSGVLDQQRLRAASEAVFTALDDLLRERRERLDERVVLAEEKQLVTMRLTLLLAFGGFIFAVAVASFFVYNISSGFRKLKKATHRIAEGEFDYDPGLPQTGEFGELAHDFMRMGARLKELEEVSLDASPLTRLPGNIAIERSLNRRLREPKPFALAYADLDNFKAYNDRYGYVQGSEIIKVTGEIIFNAVKNHGEREGFVGHIGGDDFVMIVSAEKIGAVCEEVIDEFTKMIRSFYTEEDFAVGAIRGVDRYGVERDFPVMTISIAVLECMPGDFASAADIAQAAAEIKDRVKMAPGSNYFIHRGGTA